MPGDAPKVEAAQAILSSASVYSFIQQLIDEGFFDSPVTSAQVVLRIREKFSRRLKSSNIQPYMRKFMLRGVIQAVKLGPHGSNYWVVATVDRKTALNLIGKSRRIIEIEHELFAEPLKAKLKRDFSVELDEVQGIFGNFGNSSAFLLRKILEKLLIIVFRKVGKGSLIESGNKPGGLIGLDAMIELAAREKVAAAPILSGKTASAIKGVKFLGDTAAHNPLINVDMNEIVPQMPYIVTAYKELALHL